MSESCAKTNQYRMNEWMKEFCIYIALFNAPLVLCTNTGEPLVPPAPCSIYLDGATAAFPYQHFHHKGAKVLKGQENLPVRFRGWLGGQISKGHSEQFLARTLRYHPYSFERCQGISYDLRVRTWVLGLIWRMVAFLQLVHWDPLKP